MHRKILIANLQCYRRRYPLESTTVNRFLDFVRGNERCFHRDCLPGHVTASAWVVDPGQSCVLLTLHKKLNRWLQPGGHCDGQTITLDVALREAAEETGLEVTPCFPELLDIDIHAIPARGQEPPHHHFDVRYALAAKSEHFFVSEESHDLAWAPFARLADYTTEASIMRMLGKWQSLSARQAAAGQVWASESHPGSGGSL